jgi:c-di-GMP-related signal transduction protein
MDTNRAYIGAAILIGIVVFSNLILYAMARNITRDINYTKTMQNSLEKQDASLEELRKKVEELESKKKEDDN